LAGAVMVIIVLFKPRGLIPEKPETSMSTERIQEIIARINGNDEAPTVEAAPSQASASSDADVSNNQTTEEISTQKEPPDSNG
ncbi:MAG: hypothetical protein ACFFBL_12245, partial [Promethearchaeota archaeon]